MFFWREFCVYSEFWYESKSGIFGHCAIEEVKMGKFYIFHVKKIVVFEIFMPKILDF